jgi:hypothetical protein
MASYRVRSSRGGEAESSSGDERSPWDSLMVESPEVDSWDSLMQESSGGEGQGAGVGSGAAEIPGEPSPAAAEKPASVGRMTRSGAVAPGVVRTPGTRKGKKGFKVPAAKEDAKSAVSRLDAAMITRFKAGFDIPDSYTLRPAEEGERMIHSRRTWVAFRVDMFKAGLRFPLRDFHVQLFRAYRIVPCRLVPNAYADISSFLYACVKSGVTPTLSLWQYLFELIPVHNAPGFLATRCRNPEDSKLVKKATNHKRWRECFFFVKAKVEWGFDFKWSDGDSLKNPAQPDLDKCGLRSEYSKYQKAPAIDMKGGLRDEHVEKIFDLPEAKLSEAEGHDFVNRKFCYA